MKNLSIALLLVCCILPLTARSAPVGAELPNTNAEPLRLAFVTNNASDYWTVTQAGVEKAAQDFAVKVDFRIPGEGTASQQKQMVEDLLLMGVAGVAISPVDPPNQTAMLNRVAGKTLLFTQDSDASLSNRVCFVGMDNVAAGREAGQQLRRVLPAGGDIMVFVGRVEAVNAAERLRGLKETLAGTNIRILGVATDDADRAKAKSNVSDSLVKYPELAACVGLWSYNGPAILEVLARAKRLGKTKIVCFDEEDETLEGVAHGQISATIVGQPYQIGYQTVALMTKYLRGDHDVVPANRHVWIPSLTITQSNVAPFRTQLRAWYGAR